MTQENRPSRRSMLGSMLTVPAALSMGPLLGRTAAQAAGAATSELEEKLRRIITRPEFNGSWGLKFAFVEGEEPICALYSGLPLRVGSSVKVFITATAFEQLGPDHRFGTRVYGTGPVRHGVLEGDLVLVAGGDLLLGCRIQPDGSLALPQPEHTYANGSSPDFQPLPGDPLMSLRNLAGQVAGKGVRRIEGNVVVDTSLFRQVPEPAGGMPITASPMMVNDNVIDVTITASDRPGRPARIEQSPQVSYLRIVNQVRTISASGTPEPLRFTDDVARPDGTRVATLTGAVPAGTPALLYAYHLPDPGRFAELALAKALRDAGVRAEAARTAGRGLRQGTSRRLLAELVALPMSEQVKPMLKVSNNPAAATIPHLVGAIAGNVHENTMESYERFRGALFAEAGLEPNPPGGEENKYTADLFVTFLAHIHRKPYFDPLLNALTLIRTGDHPSAGHVFAKGGSGQWPADNGTEYHQALAGYIMPPGKPTVGFTTLTLQVATSPDPAEHKRLTDLMRTSMTEIITTVYDTLA